MRANTFRLEGHGLAGDGAAGEERHRDRQLRVLVRASRDASRAVERLLDIGGANRAAAIFDLQTQVGEDKLVILVEMKAFEACRSVSSVILVPRLARLVERRERSCF